MSSTCFVIMPFGQKEDIDGTIIDFDQVYADLIKPAIEAMQLKPLRCDEITKAGWIYGSVALSGSP